MLGSNVTKIPVISSTVNHGTYSYQVTSISDE